MNSCTDSETETNDKMEGGNMAGENRPNKSDVSENCQVNKLDNKILPQSEAFLTENKVETVTSEGSEGVTNSAAENLSGSTISDSISGANQRQTIVVDEPVHHPSGSVTFTDTGLANDDAPPCSNEPTIPAQPLTLTAPSQPIPGMAIPIQFSLPYFPLVLENPGTSNPRNLAVNNIPAFSNLAIPVLRFPNSFMKALGIPTSVLNLSKESISNPHLATPMLPLVYPSPVLPSLNESTSEAGSISLHQVAGASAVVNQNPSRLSRTESQSTISLQSILTASGSPLQKIALSSASILGKTFSSASETSTSSSGNITTQSAKEGGQSVETFKDNNPGPITSGSLDDFCLNSNTDHEYACSNNIEDSIANNTRLNAVLLNGQPTINLTSLLTPGQVALNSLLETLKSTSHENILNLPTNLSADLYQAILRSNGNITQTANDRITPNLENETTRADGTNFNGNGRLVISKTDPYVDPDKIIEAKKNHNKLPTVIQRVEAKDSNFNRLVFESPFNQNLERNLSDEESNPPLEKETNQTNIKPQSIKSQLKQDGKRLLLKDWLINQVELNDINGLRWLDEKKTLLQIPWIHGSKSSWDPDCHSLLFQRWALYTGKYRPNIDSPSPKKWKANFRCALNSLVDVKEESKMSKKNGAHGYTVYKIDRGVSSPTGQAFEENTRPKKSVKLCRNSTDKEFDCGLKIEVASPDNDNLYEDISPCADAKSDEDFKDAQYPVSVMRRSSGNDGKFSRKRSQSKMNDNRISYDVKTEMENDEYEKIPTTALRLADENSNSVLCPLKNNNGKRKSTGSKKKSTLSDRVGKRFKQENVGFVENLNANESEDQKVGSYEEISTTLRPSANLGEEITGLNQSESVSAGICLHKLAYDPSLHINNNDSNLYDDISDDDDDDDDESQNFNDTATYGKLRNYYSKINKHQETSKVLPNFVICQNNDAVNLCSIPSSVESGHFLKCGDDQQEEYLSPENMEVAHNEEVTNGVEDNSNLSDSSINENKGEILEDSRNSDESQEIGNANGVIPTCVEDIEGDT